MKRKLFVGLIVSSFALAPMLTSCGETKLKVYNWGEYIDISLIKEFEKEYKCKVRYTNYDSNEIAITQMRNTTFDVVVPSDYAIEQLAAEDLIQELDWTKIMGYMDNKEFDETYEFDASANEVAKAKAKSMYADGLVNIIDKLKNDENSFDFLKYAAPYFWGNVGIIYNKDKAGLKEAVESSGWEVVRNPNYKIAYYNSARDGFMPALKQNGYSMNTTDTAQINTAKEWLKEQNRVVGKNLNYLTDEVLEQITNGSYDLGLVYSGDAVYIMQEANGINFDFFVPTTGTNVWADGMVIGKDSNNVDLAHKFIAFMSSKDASLRNASTTCYNASNKDAFKDMLESEDFVDYADMYNYTPKENDEIYRYLGENGKRLYDDAWTEVINSRD